MKEESFEEYLKKVVPASQEDIRIVEASKKRPYPGPEKVEAQLRASGAWRGRAPKKPHSESTSGQDEQKQHGT